jgi:hypothetical protein
VRFQRRAHNENVRPALFVFLIASVIACAAPAPVGGPAPPIVVAEEEVSLEISALM